MRKLFVSLSPWQRYLTVTVLSFPLALGIRLVLQQILPEDLAGKAVAVVRKQKERPLSEPLARILAENVDATRPTLPHSLLGQDAVDFTLRNTEGKEVSLAGLREQGPLVVIFYYGYYCPHCVAQLFGVNEDIALFNELGVRVIAVSADPPELTAKRFQRYGRFGFEVVSDSENKVAQAYGIYKPATADQAESLVHATFLVGQNGRVFWANFGPEPFLDNKTLLIELARNRGLATTDDLTRSR